jgi:hypothetical protein
MPMINKIVNASLQGKSAPSATGCVGLASRALTLDAMARIEADTRTLCEACGYDLAGLPPGATCGECGRPVELSLPARRVGSAWQQRPGIAAWVRTADDLLRRPPELWSRVRVESVRSSSLTMTNAAVATALPMGAIIASPSVGLGSGLSRFSVAMLVTWLAIWGGTWVALLVLTWIEARGIRFFGSRSGWRVNHGVAWAVCGHASYGWLVAGGLVAVLWVLLEHTGALGLVGGLWDWIISLVPGAPSPGSTRSTRSMELSYLSVLASGFIIGMLAFETLVYIGVRRLKFANTLPEGPLPKDNGTHPGAGPQRFPAYDRMIDQHL